ncbi:MAG TPA: hypothetical protein VM370_09945 [Candidatus Thermoplasmatota archaeon]|nr:hypothetical protein [Candidatus Thermoplasmatota archaeon]
MRTPQASEPTIPEMVEELYVFTEPLLNSRFHGMLLRRNLSGRESELARIPGLVLDCSRVGRRGAEAWAARRTGMEKEAEFVAWAEHTILDGFLSLTEQQLRVISHLARLAPTAEIRTHFDAMAATHREIATTLRGALKTAPRGPTHSDPVPVGRRSVQEEEPAGDFRGQIEAAVHNAQTTGRGVRRIILSHVGLRHLRDQGLFRDGNSKVHGVPVTIDLGWEAPAFALETYDQVLLEEIQDADR